MGDERTTQNKQAVVIGAGIVGVSTAIWLQRDGFDVTLIDREGPAAGTSYGNGGILASCACVPVTGPGLVRKAPTMLFNPNEPLFMKWGYLPKLAPWLRKYLSYANVDDTRRIAAAIAGVTSDSLEDHLALSAGTKAAAFVVPTDYLYVYKDRQAFEGDAFGWQLRAENGFTWDELEGADLAAYDPTITPDYTFGVCMGNHGIISDPGKYVKALAAHFEASAGKLVQAAVEDFAIENGRITGVRAGGTLFDCEHCVLATGVWSKPLMKKLGLDVPLESERGYHVELWGPSAMPRSPLMIAAGKFVATPMEGRIRLAGVVEFGGLDAAPSRAPFELLRKNVKEAFPGLTWEREEEWMGHRPAPADSIPVIGEVPTAKGLYTGFGHHHIGLTAGPKTGRILAQLIAGRKPNLDVRAYSPARFVSSG